MKRSNESQRAISRLVDGELAGRAEEQARARLEHTPELARDAAFFREVGELLREEPAPAGPAPEAAWQDIRRAIRIAETPRESAGSLLGSRLGWATATIAAVLVAAGGIRLAVGPSRVAAAPTEVDWVETGVAGAATMVYQDDETGLTVIWVLEGDEADHDKLDS